MGGGEDSLVNYAWPGGFAQYLPRFFPLAKYQLCVEWAAENVLQDVTSAHLDTILLFKLKTIFKKEKLLGNLLCIGQYFQYFPQD